MALRQHFTGFIKGSIVFIPMVLIGFDSFIVVTVGSLNLVYQFGIGICCAWLWLCRLLHSSSY